MTILNIIDKGDAIKYCLLNDKDIKEIDSAIPAESRKLIEQAGYNNQAWLGTVYYRDGQVEIKDLLSHVMYLELRRVNSGNFQNR